MAVLLLTQEVAVGHPLVRERPLKRPRIRVLSNVQSEKAPEEAAALAELGRPRPMVRCRPAADTRLRCDITKAGALGSSTTEIEVDSAHPELSVIC